MNRSRIGFVGVCLSILVSLALTGCHNDKAAAADTVKQFMEAIKSGNETAAKGLLTKKAQEKSGSGANNMMGGKGQLSDYTLGEAVVTDDTAEVPVTAKGPNKQSQELKIKLRKEDGQWRVFAMAVSAGGMSLTIDFENPEAFLNNLKGLSGGMSK